MTQPILRGDIVMVDLTGSYGQELNNDAGANGRPCLVVQNNRGNTASLVIIVAPLTDGRQAIKKLPILVEVTAAELGAGGKTQLLTADNLERLIKGGLPPN